MKKIIMAASVLAVSSNVSAQSRLSNQELSINAFRNPSIGLEFRHRQVSVHAGYYPTNFTSGVTTEFIRTGVTL